MRKFSAHRGVVLLSVMFVTLLVAMYIVSSLLLSRGQVGALNSSTEARLAENAARSGLEYAQARLEEDPEWCGNGTGVIVDTPELIIREDAGNVIGLIIKPDGSRAQFRLRFNYQDGAGGGDELDDPTSDMWIDSPHVSLNNLASQKPRPLPLGTGSQYQVTGKDAGHVVPSFSVAIVSEGRVYPGLASAKATDMNPAPSGKVFTRVIESIYRVASVQGDDSVTDAVTMANGDINFSVFHGGQVNLASSDGSGSPRIRGRANLTAQVLDSKELALISGVEGEIMLPTQDGKKVGNLKANLSSTMTQGIEKTTDPFYKLTWNQASKISSKAKSIPAGVYVYWSKDQSLHYYDMDFSKFKDFIKKDPDNSGSTLTSSQLDALGIGVIPPSGATNNKVRIELTNDLDVAPSGKNGKVQDLAILPRAGAKEDLSSSDTGTGLSDPAGGDVWSYYGVVPGLSNFDLIDPVALAVKANTQGRADFLAKISPHGGKLTWEDGSERSVSWGPNGTAIVLSGTTAEGLVGLIKRLGVEPDDIEFTPTAGFSNDGSLFQADDDDFEFQNDTLSRIIYGSGDGMGENPSMGDTLSAGDVEVVMGSSNSSGTEGVKLRAPGRVLMAANLKGEGASIVSGGGITIVGTGVQLDAGLPAEGVGISLYSKGKIRLSTLSKSVGKDYAYQGLDLRGVLYSWSDIELKAGENLNHDATALAQKARLQGSMIAYGGDPSDGKSKSKGGSISIEAGQIDLTFDARYLLGLADKEEVRVKLAPLSTSFR